MNLPPPPPPPQDNDPIITQFKPVNGQSELSEGNIKRIESATGHTILHNYCKYINTTPLEVYRYLIEKKGCDINSQDGYQDTPFHNALRSFDPNDGGDITVLTYLLNHKDVNANIKGNFGQTILHIACDMVNILPLDIFKLLIETHGANVNVLDEYKDTPLHSAIRRFDPDTGGNITVLTDLINQKQVDVNVRVGCDSTLLHTACININRLPIDIFRLLIETYNCDVNAQDNFDDTPLHTALYYFDPNHGGDINVLTYLLTQTAINVNTWCRDGSTLLHYACDNITQLPLDVFKVLIETMGFGINDRDDNNDTPIHRALESLIPHNGGDITSLAYLLNQKDVNVNIRYKKGYTLLHLVCLNNLSESMDSAELDVECDTTLFPIIEVIAERCVQDVFDEKTPLEATTTTM
jgi:ankyrin repeat protein